MTVREVSEAWKIMNDEIIQVAEIIRYDPILGQILEELAIQLNNDQFIDFSLMIRLVVEALENDTPGALRAISGLRHLMVDEYQDINPSQERLVRALHSVRQLYSSLETMIRQYIPGGVRMLIIF